MSARLTVLRHGADRWDVSGADTIATVDRLKAAVGGAGMFSHLFRYREARILTHRLETIGRPLKLALFLRLMSRGSLAVEDEQQRRRDLSLALIGRWAWQSIREPFQKSALLSQLATEVETLVAAARSQPKRALDLTRRPLYLRTDLSFGLRAGGSVGHTAGVLNHLAAFGGPPLMLTTDYVPTVDPAIEVATVSPDEAFWEYPELPSLVMNRQFARVAAVRAAGTPLSFVYQRYSLNNFSGARLSVERKVPFVLEYNGSEIWMSRNWGSPLQYEALSEKIEFANLDIADVIVVVSQPMADELIGRGVDARKILVNPNGVEPERYSPAIDGSAVRARYDLDGKIVIGFIGTFGPWHGAEVLARAFGALVQRYPRFRSNVRLLMIGDGVKMPEVKEALDRGGVSDLATLTGIVAQADGPAHLAACDILASPHVANADGTPFFGSPTKLFEYMAMGKAIVASDLDQVGEILEHGRAAQMAIPGDLDTLVEGLRLLIDDSGRRAALGAEARRIVVERHTWRAHTGRIIDALRERVPSA
jgi:glycosyltransferase involved in cell wall biosynthesis